MPCHNRNTVLNSSVQISDTQSATSVAVFSQTSICPHSTELLFLLHVYCCLYLGSWLEDPELLRWGQRCVQRDNYHGTTAVRQMLGDVPARPRQSLDFLLTRHED